MLLLMGHSGASTEEAARWQRPGRTQANLTSQHILGFFLFLKKLQSSLMCLTNCWTVVLLYVPDKQAKSGFEFAHNNY